jgi:hypothetical protein
MGWAGWSSCPAPAGWPGAGQAGSVLSAALAVAVAVEAGSVAGVAAADRCLAGGADGGAVLVVDRSSSAVVVVVLLAGGRGSRGGRPAVAIAVRIRIGVGGRCGPGRRSRGGRGRPRGGGCEPAGRRGGRGRRGAGRGERVDLQQPPSALDRCRGATVWPLAATPGRVTPHSITLSPRAGFSERSPPDDRSELRRSDLAGLPTVISQRSTAPEQSEMRRRSHPRALTAGSLAIIRSCSDCRGAPREAAPPMISGSGARATDLSPSHHFW